MEAVELQLFNQEKTVNNSLPNKIPTKESKPLEPISNPQKTLEKALSAIFTPQDEGKIVQARRIFGEAVTGVSDEQLGVFVNELQYLLDGWFDVFERQVFKGSTLREILKGGQDGTA